MTHRTHHSHSHSHSHSHGHSHGAHTNKRLSTFSKVFRWQPKPGDPIPAKVEIVGSFNSWQPQALQHDRFSKHWQLTLHDIPGNCTHHYMLLVDGQPANDKHCDGLAMPETDEEKQYQYESFRGPRIFILLSQTK